MPHRVLAVAESDSYLKWSVSLLAQLPAETQVQVVVARSPVRPSAAQQAAALAGTTQAGRSLDVVSPAQLKHRIERDRPDAVLLACTGPTVHCYQEVLSRAAHRPVLMAGIPGIALPARRRAWGFRGAIDLMIVHSHREVEEYERVRVATGKRATIGLATIPFLAPDARRMAEVTGGVPIIEPSVEARLRNRVLFATQGKVPVRRSEREQILLALAELARSRPDLRVVVKTRGVVGEFHTHYEQFHYEVLWRDLVRSRRVASSALIQFEAGSMAEQLRTAAALITVSSTAVLEAMALDIPVLLLDDFGVNPQMINEVFAGSGCQRGLDALIAADFRHPDVQWSTQNYFHPVAENTWMELLDDLVEQAQAGKLPALTDGLDPGRSDRRRRRDRMRLTWAGSELSRARQRLISRIHTKDPQKVGDYLASPVP